MKTIKKYLLLIFLLENIAAQTFLLRSYTDIFFYVILFMGFIGIMDLSILKKENFQKFKWAYLLSAIYTIYLFVIAPQYIEIKNLQYLIAKIMTFIIIITSLSNFKDFYEHRFFFWIMIFMAFFLLYGLITGEGVYVEGRDSAGFTNPNTAGSMGATLIGILIFYLRNRKWNIFYYFLIFLGLYGIMAGASRAAFLILGIFIFFRYGISVKTLFLSGIVLFMGFFLLDYIGIHTTGMQRIMDTYSGELGTNRDAEREAAMIMITESPYIGWGFEFQNVGNAETIAELGPHNGYLELTEQMGIPIAIIFFLICLVPVIKNLYYIIKYSLPPSLFFCIVIATFFAANYESLFVGVHEFATNLFFFALAIISSSNYEVMTKRN